MFTLDIPTILGSLHPGAQWVVRGPQNDYANLEWLDQSTAPTEAEMLSAELAAAKAARTAKVKLEAAARITAAYPMWKQINCALGAYDSTATAAIKVGIAAIRTGSDAAESAIAALAIVSDAVSFTW